MAEKRNPKVESRKANLLLNSSSYNNFTYLQVGIANDPWHSYVASRVAIAMHVAS